MASYTHYDKERKSLQEKARDCFTQKRRVMTEQYSEDLINMAASAFLRDTHINDANDKYKCKEWVAKLKKITHKPVVAYYVYYYKGEEVTTITSNDFILEDNKFIDFVRGKAIALLDSGWKPIKKELKTTITELPNTLEYL